MERIEDLNPKLPKEAEAKSRVWDCDSCLYDSFELRSFKRQLDSAIATRTLSMPRGPPLTRSLTRSSKMTRALRKLVHSVFRKIPASDSTLQVDGCSEVGVYVMCSSTRGVLPKISQVWETDIHCSERTSPEIGKLLVRKSAS